MSMKYGDMSLLSILRGKTGRIEVGKREIRWKLWSLQKLAHRRKFEIRYFKFSSVLEE